MSEFIGFGDKYDLTVLKQYVKDNKIMEKFTPEEQKGLEAMAKEFDKRMIETYKKLISREENK